MLEVTMDRVDAERILAAIKDIVSASLFYEETDGDEEQVTYLFRELPEDKQVAIEEALDRFDVRFAWR